MELSILTPSTPSGTRACRFRPGPDAGGDDADATVCHCFGVRESTLKQTISQHGARSVDELSRHTGAGEGCQACHCRLVRVLAGLPAKCSGRFDLCGQCGCLEVNCDCTAA